MFLPVLPLLIHFGCAALLVLCGGSRPMQRAISTAGAVAGLLAAGWLLREVWSKGTLVLNVGNWKAPFGIVLVADLLAVLMVAVSAFVGLAVCVYSSSDRSEGASSPAYLPLLHILLGGVAGAFLTGDLFNLFVWFEVLLMASFVLLVLGGRPAQLRGGLTYLTLNFLSSGFFLIALGILYGKTGTLNMADLSGKLPEIGSGAAFSSLMLLLTAFGIKAGLFPFFSWLPASYHTPVPAVSAIFAGLLTKVGVYAMIRIFTLADLRRVPDLQSILLILSVATMIIGVLGAATQYDIRRILSFHIISQIGYIVLGLALFTEAAVAAAVFYTLHHIVVKTNLFLIGGVIERVHGTGDLKCLGGLARSRPWLAVAFLVPALSLGGIPPLSGFFAKYLLLAAGFEVAAYVAVGAGLFAGLLTLFSMSKIWSEAFWKEPPPPGQPIHHRIPWTMGGPIGVMAGVTILLGLQPEWLLGAGRRVAMEVMNREVYLQTVLEVGR